MIRNILRMVALWRPPQRVEDGKLMRDQCRICEAKVIHGPYAMSIHLTVHEPCLNENLVVRADVTHEYAAELKAGLGHHIITELTRNFINVISDHPRAAEATPFHHHQRPR